MISSTALSIVAACAVLGQVDEERAREQARQIAETFRAEFFRDDDPSPLGFPGSSGRDPRVDQFIQQIEDGEVRPLGAVMQDIEIPDMTPTVTPIGWGGRAIIMLVVASAASLVSWLSQRRTSDQDAGE